MKEAKRTTFNLSLLFYFMLLVAGFALFGTNYYRAFLVKNKMITLIEQYEANFTNIAFKEKREETINKVGYRKNAPLTQDSLISEGWNCPNEEGWCYKLDKQNYNENNSTEVKCVYQVKTFVSTDIPVINRLFSSFKFFEVNGVTKEIRRRDGCSK